MSKQTTHLSPPIILYGTAIHRAIATGDLAKMKALVRQAEQFLAEHGHVAAALEMLKIEIAKIEARGQ